MDTFCNSTYWDSNLTWNTDHPDLTPCFQQTVLIWIPFAFLSGLLPFNLFSNRRTNFFRKRVTINKTSKFERYNSHFVCSWLFLFKLILCCGLLILNLLHLIQLNDSNAQFISSALWSAILTRILSYILVLVVTIRNKMNGVTSSGGMFVYWLITLICDTLIFQSALRNEHNYSNNITQYANILQFSFVVLIFLSNCWADKPKITRSKKETANPCPDQTASFLSRLLFYWYEDLAWNGYKKPIQISDLWDLNESESCQHQVPKFYKYWQGSKDGICKPLDGISNLNGEVFSTAIKALLQTLLLGSLFQLMSDLLGFVSPEILKLLISFTKSKDMETWKGYLFVSILLVSSTLQTVFTTQFMQVNLLLFMRMKTMLMSAIYRKALRISSVARKHSSVGEIVNLMSVDVNKLMNAVAFINEFWSAPLKIGISTYLLWNILGPSVLAGVLVIILLIPINSGLGKWARILQVKQMKNKDQRVKLMSEILAGIKVLKLYAFEPPFEKEVMIIRSKEQDLLRKAAYLTSFTSLVSTCAPFLVSLVTFAVFVLIDENNVLDSEKAFVSLALFNIMRQPLHILPVTIVIAIEANVAAKRINKFLNAEERDDGAIETQRAKHLNNCGSVITMTNANFAWDPSLNIDTFGLRSINLNVKEGSLIAIVGTVASGKSSLLCALLGNMVKSSGKVTRIGKVAYVAQQPWIQNCSLRDNILFGQELNERKYQSVIEACALQPDIDILPAGDRTEIGEKGVNLSGGQRARTGLARAVFSNAQIYFLDDPLSAVDAHVGQHLFDKVLGPKGLLKSSTRLLVTNDIKYLKHVDNIVVMKEGAISEMGTYEDLIGSGAAFFEFLSHSREPETEKVEVVNNSSNEIHHLPSHTSLNSHRRNMEISKRRNSSVSSATSAISLQDLEEVPDDIDVEEEQPEQEKLIQAEKMEVGSVNRDVYLHFMKSMGIIATSSGILFIAAFQALQVGSSVWLARWSNEASDNITGNSTISSNNNINYLSIYGAFGLGQAITTMAGTVAISLALLKAAAILHQKMLSRIFHAPMIFFETTPIGRILNRFSKDVDAIDSSISTHLRSMLQNLASLLATITIISINMPLFILAVLFLSILYYFITAFYIASKGQLKRMTSVSMSPIFSQFSETLTGMTTIRAYGAESRFIQESDNRIDFHQKCYYPSIVGNRWLAVRLETIANLVVFVAGLLAVLGRDSLDPGTVGLSICYAMQVTSTLNWMVRMISAVETDAVSVERIIEYGQIEQEADWEVGNKPPKNWPDKGRITFGNCQARYRPGLDLALRNVNCDINPGEKIGVVGRTGAGKSSMVLIICRIIETIYPSSIVIDDIDISTLGLHDIRGRITIIPQDPVIFSGTLRMNLDPFSEYLDTDIWRALELAHLKQFVMSQCPNGIMHEISEGGDNLSSGQKQLVFLAKALLRKTRILILDEATASIDLETDELIQQTIRKEFSNSTVITIAHRLNTIMDYDRVMVLDQGEVVELDSPGNLLQDQNSIFYSLSKTAGLL